MDNWIYSRDFPRGEKHYIDRIGNSLNILNKMIHIHNLYLYTLYHFLKICKELLLQNSHNRSRQFNKTKNLINPTFPNLQTILSEAGEK